MIRTSRPALLLLLLALLGAGALLVWRLGSAGAAPPALEVRPERPEPAPLPRVSPLADMEPAALLPHGVPSGAAPTPLPRASGADLHGRVFDAAGGWGVPGLVVRLFDAADALLAEVETELDGTFAAPGVAPHPGLRAVVVDAFTGDGELGSFEWPATAPDTPPDESVKPWTLRVAVGPTFLFRPDVEDESAPVASADLRARVLAVGPDAGTAGSIDVQRERLRLLRPGWLTPELEAHVRARQAGEPPAYSSSDPSAGLSGGAIPRIEWPWVPAAGEGPVLWTRYPVRRAPLEPRPDLRLRLEVATQDGALSGVVDLESTRGVHPGRLGVLLREPCTLSGVVLDREGYPVSEATVSLVRESSVATFAPWDRTHLDGGFLLGVQRPGDYRLRIQFAGTPAVERAVALAPGHNALRPVKLPVADRPSTVTGELQCAADEERWIVLLESAVATGFGQGRMVVVPRPDDLPPGEPVTREASFAFDEVPEGEYFLRVFPADPYIGSRRSRNAEEELVGHVERIRVPCEPLAVACSDAALTDAIGFTVTSAEGAVPLRRLCIGFGPDGARLEPVRSASVNATWQVPRGALLEWLVWQHGYQPRTGDETAFEGEGGVRRAVVALEEGWGARLFFRELPAEGEAGASSAGLDARLPVEHAASRAVAGVRVLVEGRVVATSDARGMVLIALPEEPDELVLECPGWAAVELEQPQPPRETAHLESTVWMLRM